MSTKSVKDSQVFGLSISRVGRLGDECRIEDCRRTLAALVEQGKRARGCGIGELARRQVDAVLGNRIGRQQRQNARGILIVALRRTLRVLPRIIPIIIAAAAALRDGASHGESKHKHDQKRTTQV